MAGTDSWKPMTRHLRIDELLGRTVWTRDGHRVGRLEECRAQRDGSTWFVRECLIGSAGLFERLGLSALLVVGVNRHAGYVSRWDQLDISDPRRLRLRCPVAQLEERPQ